MDFLKKQAAFLNQVDASDIRTAEIFLWLLLLLNLFCFVLNCFLGSWVLFISLSAIALSVYNLQEYYDVRSREKK